MPTIRPVKADDLTEIRAAIAKLREARDLLAHAGAKRAAEYVRRALKSAEGAERHALRAWFVQVQADPEVRSRLEDDAEAELVAGVAP